MRLGVRRCVPVYSLHERGEIGRSLADTVDSAGVEAALPFRTARLKFRTSSLADNEILTAADPMGSRAPQNSGSNS